MTMSELIRFAYRIVREVHNGVRCAAHWLASLGYDLAVALAIIRGA